MCANLETLRKNFIDQFNEVGKAMKAKQEELTQLEVQLEQLRGAIFGMDRALEESAKKPVETQTTPTEGA